jgi:hypothetical protein
MEFHIDKFLLQTKSYHHVKLNVTNSWNHEHYEN